MSSGYESGGFGLIHLDGSLTERARVAGAVARVVDRNQSLFLNARPPQARVAVIYNPLAHFVGGRQRATAYGGPQGEVASIERDSLLGIHKALFPRNVPLDYVHIDNLSAAALAPYRLVYLPYPLMLPEKAAGPLREFVGNGGALVAEARLGWNNERGLAADRIPGMGLWEVMGCRETEVQTGAKGRTEIRWTGTGLAGFAAGALLPARWYEETLEPLRPDARVVAEFPNGAAAAVLSQYGKGKTLMLGSYVSAAYQTTPSPDAARFFESLLGWAGVDLPLTATGGVEARLLESGPDRLLFVFNHASAPADAAITLHDAQTRRFTATDLIAQQPVAFASAGSAPLELRRRIGPRDVWVIRLSPR
jgi:beta-galactosidase